jgi:hypothetical protein
VQSSPSFLDYNSQTYIFFGSNDDMIYAVDSDGNALTGWPVAVNGTIGGSVVFSDLDNDGDPEVVAATDMGDVIAFHLDGSYVNYFPIVNGSPSSGSPMITDLDDDGDLEIFAGSVSNLVVIDIKEQGISEGYWNEFRGGFERRGSNRIGGCMDGGNTDYTNIFGDGSDGISICDYDINAVWDDGSCSKKDYECENGTQGCDCRGVCNGNVLYDTCGICGGSGPSENYDCSGECTADIDCNGACGGTAEDDVCGTCGGIITDATQCACPDGQEQDCTGICGGSAVVTDCGCGIAVSDEITGCCPSALSPNDEAKDCAGICGGSAVLSLIIGAKCTGTTTRYFIGYSYTAATICYDSTSTTNTSTVLFLPIRASTLSSICNNPSTRSTNIIFSRTPTCTIAIYISRTLT